MSATTAWTGRGAGTHADDDVVPAQPAPRRGAAVGLLAEVLLSGAVLAVASIPVVTAVPALAAGAGHLRAHLAGETDSIGGLLRRLVTALRGLWAVGLAVPALLLVLAFDAWLAATGALPGGPVVSGVCALVAVAAVVVPLRLAGTWRPGVAARSAIGEAVRACLRDPVGTVLLAAAVGVVAVVVWMLVPLVLIAPGLLALAALGVEERRARLADAAR
ncbi:hypothetical protein GXB85_09810 [Cellulomonas sp. APG4]|uniref:hypothetical protein n=1 Tax=Cellulomonas sp. APG4 TaxID=1538656 RepID=UPI00137B6CA1|nr:hypothetical protein [Cellulomonas sp. APG4]NCT91243.1 hypothetical protein [Cellulomonas sp. APG4]